MTNQYKGKILRALGYICGLLLFFAPFSFYQRTIIYLFNISNTPTIHAMCLRTPLVFLINGDLQHVFTLSFFSFSLLMVVTLFHGPFFCGKLCPVGALPEYFSRLIPSKLQFDWYRYISPQAARYGFFAGFLLSPYFGGTIAHVYCNFNLMEKLLFLGSDQAVEGYFSSTIITLFIWLVLFGFFTRGGRGYCNYFCPVGAMQSLVYMMGIRLGLAAMFRIEPLHCSSCQQCRKQCPVGAIDTSLTIDTSFCITCGACQTTCPHQAISFMKAHSHSLTTVEKVLP